MSHDVYFLSPSTEEFKFSQVAFSSFLPLPLTCPAEKLLGGLLWVRVNVPSRLQLTLWLDFRGHLSYSED